LSSLASTHTAVLVVIRYSYLLHVRSLCQFVLAHYYFNVTTLRVPLRVFCLCEHWTILSTHRTHTVTFVALRIVRTSSVLGRLTQTETRVLELLGRSGWFDRCSRTLRRHQTNLGWLRLHRQSTVLERSRSGVSVLPPKAGRAQARWRPPPPHSSITCIVPCDTLYFSIYFLNIEICKTCWNPTQGMNVAHIGGAVAPVLCRQRPCDWTYAVQ
jgi:hypothetical protein